MAVDSQAWDQNQYPEGWLAENRIYLPLPDVSGDLRDIDDVQVMGMTLAAMAPDSGEQAVLAQTKVAWAFLRWVAVGDMVIVASREARTPFRSERLNRLPIQ